MLGSRADGTLLHVLCESAPHLEIRNIMADRRSPKESKPVPSRTGEDEQEEHDFNPIRDEDIVAPGIVPTEGHEFHDDGFHNEHNEPEVYTSRNSNRTKQTLPSSTFATRSTATAAPTTRPWPKSKDSSTHRLPTRRSSPAITTRAAKSV